jgi:homoserine kinase type II
MAVYTDVDDAALAAFLENYDLGPALAFKGIAEGVENSNFLLETAKGRFILTLFEKRVQRADLPFFLGLKTALAGSGFPCPLPVAGRDGVALRELAGKAAVIVTFLTGLSPRVPNAAQCRALGEGLARLHVALQTSEAAQSLTRANALGHAAWPGLFAGREAAAARLAPGLDRLVAADIARIAAQWPLEDRLPTGLIHADLFPDNAFFLGDQLSGVIDFYFACRDSLAYDVAICLNAWCFEPRGEYNLTRGRALLAGYQSVRPLEEAERAALPVLALGAAMRFFLTRLVDWSSTPEGALVRPKNPVEYADKLAFHRRAQGPHDYGL